MGTLNQGKTLGIIGLGTIGKRLVEVSKGFRFKIIACDFKKDSAFAKLHNIEYCDLGDLLSRSDIVSIHLNLTQQTENLINEQKLNLMKKKSILINTSRGEVIDENALFRLLKNKQILGAGLDVFKNEPYSGKLLNLKNVIATPHIGSYALELRNKMEIESVQNLILGLKKS